MLDVADLHSESADLDLKISTTTELQPSGFGEQTLVAGSIPTCSRVDEESIGIMRPDITQPGRETTDLDLSLDLATQHRPIFINDSDFHPWDRIAQGG